MGRPATCAIALSLLSLPFLLPHVMEDFQLGIAQRFGLTAGQGAALLGAGLAVQVLGLILAGQGRRLGLLVTAMAGVVWVAGAVWDHGPGLAAAGWSFRGSVLSALWVVGLASTQLAAAVAAAIALVGTWRR